MLLDLCKNLALNIRDCVSLCLSVETLKAVGPFYLVSMPGDVNVSPVMDATLSTPPPTCNKPHTLRDAVTGGNIMNWTLLSCIQ